METLEDRILFDAVPQVKVDMAPGGPADNTIDPVGQPMINENFNFSVRFQNTGSQTGYAPFIDLKVAKGLDLTAAPTYLGTALTQVAHFENTGAVAQNFTHPYLTSPGNVITLNPGEEFYVWDLPFGSYVPGQQPLDVMFTGRTDKVGEGAVVGSSYLLNARGGFRYGLTPTDDAPADPAIISSGGNSGQGTVIPRVWEVGKDLLIHEDETATGSNFEVPWELSVDVATGETVANVQLVDQLPNNLMFIPTIGKVQISINGGAFTTLNSAQWTFRDAHNGTLSTADDTEPGGTFTVNLGAITGQAGMDVRVRYVTFVPEFEHDDGDASGSSQSGSTYDGDNGNGVDLDPILDPITGASDISRNGVNGTGFYDLNNNGIQEPGENTVTDSVATPFLTPNTDTLQDQSLVVQKSVTGNTESSNDGATPNFVPGDSLTYHMDFQVSDYFQFNNLYMVDKMGDGQVFDAARPVTLTWTEAGVTYTATLNVGALVTSVASFGNSNGVVQTQYFAGSTLLFTTYYNSSQANEGFNVSSIDPYLSYLTTQGVANTTFTGGQTVFVFNMSNIMAQAAGAAGSPGGAGSLFGGYSENRAVNRGATTGSLSYGATVLKNYVGVTTLDSSIDIGDTVTNGVNIYGNVIELTNTQSLVGDDSGTSLVIAPPQLQKSIYAINGVNPPAVTTLGAGDTITYRLDVTLPVSDIERLSITDFIPLPKFLVTELLPANFTVVKLSAWTGVPPAAGHLVVVLPDAIFDALNNNAGADGLATGLFPNFVFDAATNSFRVDLGSFDLPIGATSNLTVSIFFTVTTQSTPMADDLKLTNQLVATYDNTGATNVVDASIIQITIREPKVDIYKGVVASTQGGSPPFTSGTSTGDFADVSGNGMVYSGAQAYLSAGLAGVIGAANLTTGTLPDAGDVVRFAVIAQNTGHNSAYRVQLQDKIENSYDNTFANVGAFISGTNFKVYNGAGVLLNLGTDYTVTWDNGTKIFVVELTPAYALQAGKVGTTDVTNGLNSMVVTYDLTVAVGAQSRSTTTNTAKLTAYYSTPGAPTGDNFVPVPKTDTANVLIRPPQLALVLNSTSVTETGNNGTTQATIGETANYTLTLTVPEGSTISAVLNDLLQSGLLITDFTGVSVSGGVAFTNFGGSTVNVLNYLNTNFTGATNFSLDLGDITNANTDNATAETFTITYNAVIQNVVGNQAGTNLDNDATLNYKYTDVNSNASPAPTQQNAPQLTADATDVSVVEPALVLVKEVGTANSGGNPTGTYFDADTALADVFDPADVLFYRFTISNVSGPTGFNINLTDVLPISFFTAGGFTLFSATSTPGVTGFTGLGDFNITGANLTTTNANISVGAGGTITLVIKATLRPDISPNTIVSNTGNLKWTSLTGATAPILAGNATTQERTGADGTGGALNDYSVDESAIVRITAPKVDLQWKNGTLTADDTTVTTSTGGDVVIGEHATMDVVVNVPEGVTNGAVVTVTLPPGFVYDAASAQLLVDAFTADQLTAANAIGAGAVQMFFVSAVGNTVTFTLGDITVPTTGSPTSKAFVIRLSGTTTNIVGNQDGTALNSSVVLNYNNSIGTAQPTVNDTVSGNNPNMIVREPVLTLTKTASTISALPDGGDKVTYTLVLNNTSTQMAYDVKLVDQLVALLGADTLANMNGSINVTTLTGSGTTATNADFQFTSSAGSYLLSIISSNVDIAAGGSVTLQFTAIISSSVNPATTIGNTADIRWSSLPGGLNGDDAGIISERTGSTFPAGGPATGLNDYGATSSVNITTAGLSVLKAVTGTSESSTTGSNVTIGEIVTYTLTITLPDGITPDLIIQDQIPAGLQYVVGSANVVSGTFNGTLGTMVVNGGPFGNGTDIIFDFSSITVTSAEGVANNVFTITFQALVLDVPGNSGLTPPGQTTLNNTITYNDGKGGTQGTPSAPVPVVVVEPKLDITKTITTPGGTGDAQNTISYDITITNIGTSIAFDSIVQDLINPAFYDPTSILITYNVAEWATPVVNTTTGQITMTHIGAGGLGIGASVGFSISARLRDTIAPGTVVGNTATATTTTLPGVVTGERTEPPVSATANLTVPSTLLFNKTLITTSVDGDTSLNVLVGEIATFGLTTTLQQGVTSGINGVSSGVIIHDQLPTGMAYVSTSSTFVAAAGVSAVGFVSGITYTNGSLINTADLSYNSGTGQLTYRFLSVTIPPTTSSGTGSFTIQYQSVVQNVATNQQGTALLNTAYVEADRNADGDTGDGVTPVDDTDERSADKTVTLTVVEPQLTITKSHTPVGAQDAGNVISYTIVVGNTSGQTAYEVILRDVMDDFFISSDTGVFTITGATAAGPSTTLIGTPSDFFESTFDVGLGRWVLQTKAGAPAIQIGSGGSVTITYTVTLPARTTPNQIIDNRVTAYWSSLPGQLDGDDSPGVVPGNNERNGFSYVGINAPLSPGDPQTQTTPLNNYAVAALDTFTTRGQLGVVKSLVDTSQTNNGANGVAGDAPAEPAAPNTRVVIGETARFDLTTTLQEGRTSLVTVGDTLPSSGGVLQLSYLPGVPVEFISTGATAVGSVSGITYSNGSLIDSRDIAWNPSTGSLQFNFASVTIPPSGTNGAGSFVLRYTTLVMNVVPNQAATSLTNSSYVRADENNDGDNVDGGDLVVGNSVTLNIVEPTVTIGLTVDDNTPNLGQTLTYTLTLTGATGANASTAYDVLLSGLLPAGITFGSIGSVSTSGSVNTDTTASYIAGTGLVGQWDIGKGGVVTITFTGTVSTNPTYIGGTYGGGDDTLTLNVGTTWTSIDGTTGTPGAPGDPDGERTGADGVGGTLNDYAATSNVPVTIIGADLSITKDDGILIAVPGDTLAYTLVVRNIGTETATGVVLNDTLPLNAGTLNSISYIKYNSGGSVIGSGSVTLGGNITFVPESGGTPAHFTIDTASLAEMSSLLAGERIEFVVNVTVDSVVDTGVESLTNVATVTFNEIALDVTNGTAHPAIPPSPGIPGVPAYTEPNNNTASDTDTLTATPDLRIVKTASTATVNATDLFSYTITITNVGNQDLGLNNGVAYLMSDDLSEVLAVANFLSSSQPVFGISGSVYTFSLNQLAGSGGTQTITLNFQAKNPLPPGIFDFTNFVSVPTSFFTTTLTPPDKDPTPLTTQPNPGDPGYYPDGNDHSVTITLPTVPDMVITKTVDTSLIELNTVFTYTLKVQNIGLRSVTNVTIVDTLPDYLVVVDTDGGVYDPTTRTITWFLPGTFLGAAQQTNLFHVKVYIPSGSTASGTLTNTATVTDDGSNGPDINPLNNTSSVITPVHGADIRVTKDDGETVVVPGQSLTYTMVVTNFGTDTAKTVLLKDVLPDHLTLGIILVNGVPVTPTLTTDGFTIPLGDILSGSSVTIKVTALLDSVVSAGFESMTNWVYVTHSITDRTPENNMAFDTDIVEALPGLEVTKVASVPVVGPNDLITYTITVKNPGNQDASDTILIDDLDERIVNFLSATLGGTFDGNVISWTLGTIKGGGGFVEITVNVQVKGTYPSIGQLVNTATASFDEDLSGKDPTPDNNSATATLTLLSPVQFTYDSFTNFATWRPFGRDDADPFAYNYDNMPYRLPMLTVTPMYSGTADPGSTLVVEIYNALGVKVGTQNVLVDAGGNWMTSFPSTILYDYPQTVIITEQPAAVQDPTQSGFNLRTYFSPAINSSHFFNQQPDVNKVMSQMPGQVLENLYEGAKTPIRLSGEKYRYEFITAQGTPSS